MEIDSSGSPAAAASCPRWVMLNKFGYHRCTVEEANAAAAARTSTDLLIHVSLLLATPPASSRFYYGSLDSPSNQDGNGEQVDALTVVAVHGDAVLLEVRTSEKHRRPRSYGAPTTITNYFLYDKGPARLPSLLLLPGCYIAWHWQFEHKAHGCPRPTARMMHTSNTGILRGGEDELLVAQLELPYDSGEPWDRAELCVLRLSRQQEWELKRAVPIMFDDLEGIKADEVMLHWYTVTAVPVGGRFLCWVDYRLGFLLCDMAAADERLKLRYVALPVRPHELSYFDYRRCMKYSRNLASAGAGSSAAAVRFVDVEPRCSCGGRGRSTCARCFLFTVTTWTLSLSMEEPMEWVKDSVLDCDELWALPAYQGLPQVKLELPIVSSDDPDVVCFLVRDPNYNSFTDMREWMVEVDTKSKAILSIVPYTDRRVRPDDHVAAKLGC